MKRMFITLICAAAAGLALAVPGPASAAAQPPEPSPSPTASPAPDGTANRPVAPTGKSGARMQADGYVWVWGDAMWDDNGLWCGWIDNHAWWTYAWNDLYGSPGECKDTGHSFDNVASSMWNNGFAGGYDDVRFFKHATFEEPSMCLGNGDYWGNLNLGWEVFNDGSNANDQISSHAWKQNC